MKRDNPDLFTIMLMLRECLDAYTDNISTEVENLDDDEFTTDPQGATLKVLKNAFNTLEKEYNIYREATASGLDEAAMVAIGMVDLSEETPPPIPQVAKKDSGLH